MKSESLQGRAIIGVCKGVGSQAPVGREAGPGGGPGQLVGPGLGSNRGAVKSGEWPGLMAVTRIGFRMAAKVADGSKIIVHVRSFLSGAV